MTSSQSPSHSESPSTRAARATEAHLAQLSDEDLAYHEAGHAVVHYLNGGTVARLSIDRADPRRGTQTAASPRADAAGGAAAGAGTGGQQALRQKMAVLAGGEVAATLHGTPEAIVSAGGRVDHEAALRAAAEAGINSDAARVMMDEEWERVRRLLGEPSSWRLVEALARALLERKTLDADTIHAVLAG
jgi:hypothetical protein